MNTKAMISIPGIRMKQVRAIAEARKMTINDLIAHWIAQEVKQGTIPAEVPGVRIELSTKGDKAQMTVGELMLNPTCREAQELSQSLREIASGHLKAYEAKFARIVAAGTGIALEHFSGKPRFVANASIMRDVADQIDRALK